MIRILLGGSPCTHFSIAQKNNRETQPNSGIGWELFKNYLIAKEKFKPDYFLYENNKSAAQPIKDEIKKQFGVWDGTFLTPYSDVRHIEINSALVSGRIAKDFMFITAAKSGSRKTEEYSCVTCWRVVSLGRKSKTQSTLIILRAVISRICKSKADKDLQLPNRCEYQNMVTKIKAVPL